MTGRSTRLFGDQRGISILEDRLRSGQSSDPVTPPTLSLVAAAVLFLVGCATVSGMREAGPPLRARAALGARRVLVLAVSFPDVPNVPAIGRVKGRMLDAVSTYYARASSDLTAAMDLLMRLNVADARAKVGAARAP